MISLELIIPTANREDIVLFLEALLIYFEKYDSSQLNSTIIQNELNDTLVKERPFLFPPEFLFLGKSIILIDGICRKLDPSFNFFEYTTNLLQDEFMNAIDLRKFAMTAVEMPNRIKSISYSVNSIESSKKDLKLTIKKTQHDIHNTQLLTMSSIISSQAFYYHNFILMYFFISLSLYIYFNSKYKQN